jgi:bifunctional UDP-N-acetylglucosamine pyrophosphorylase / glucosamine-1-phosphate N-acetyltransferase
MRAHVEARTTAAIVLAAGKGTRFRSATPKVLHRAAGRTLLGHVLATVGTLGTDEILVVVGHGAAAVQAEVAHWAERLGRPIRTVLQDDPRGTGDALQVALAALSPAVERVLVVPGDTPLLTGPTLAGLLVVDAAIPMACLTAELDDPTGYGRILRDAQGRIIGIVEDRDADAQQSAVREINTGMYVFDRAAITPHLAALGEQNAQGERYLTDVVAQLAGSGDTVASASADPLEIGGVNDRVQLAAASAVLRRRHLEDLMRAGVGVIDPEHTYVDVDVVVGEDSMLLPGTILEGATRIGLATTVGPSSHLTDCQVGDHALVHSTRAQGVVIGDRVEVGPFAHLRPGTVLDDDVRVGAFVQTKNAHVGSGAKVPHLAYIGDAEIGAGANLACGVVTVNYDGRTKHRTTVGEGAFVGCGTMLVAPVDIGAHAYVAAGSTITEDVPPEALAIGRAHQVIKEGRARGRLG